MVDWTHHGKNKDDDADEDQQAQWNTQEIEQMLFQSMLAACAVVFKFHNTPRGSVLELIAPQLGRHAETEIRQGQSDN